MLQISNLEAWYNNIQVLYNVNLHVNENEIVAIIGPNGAGKSTVLKSIFSLTRRKGSISFNNKEITQKKSNEMIDEGISYVPQGQTVFRSLTVQENIELGAYRSRSNMQAEIKSVFQLFPVLKERSKQKAGLLSGGEQQMVALARSLVIKPKLLLLDEPSLGLSPKVKHEIFQKIKQIRKQGITIVMVEQNTRIALEMSDRAYVLEAGKNRLEGTGKELLHDKRVQHLYLGGVL